jgi:hypothetical protein
MNPIKAYLSRIGRKPQWVKHLPKQMCSMPQNRAEMALGAILIKKVSQ